MNIKVLRQEKICSNEWFVEFIADNNILFVFTDKSKIAFAETGACAPGYIESHLNELTEAVMNSIDNYGIRTVNASKNKSKKKRH